MSAERPVPQGTELEIKTQPRQKLEAFLAGEHIDSVTRRAVEDVAKIAIYKHELQLQLQPDTHDTSISHLIQIQINQRAKRIRAPMDNSEVPTEAYKHAQKFKQEIFPLYIKASLAAFKKDLFHANKSDEALTSLSNSNAGRAVIQDLAAIDRARKETKAKLEALAPKYERKRPISPKEELEFFLKGEGPGFMKWLAIADFANTIIEKSPQTPPDPSPEYMNASKHFEKKIFPLYIKKEELRQNLSMQEFKPNRRKIKEFAAIKVKEDLFIINDERKKREKQNPNK